MRIIRAGEHIQHIPGWGVTVRESGVTVAANWWDTFTDAVLVYCPKGAMSYAASKVNLANPGTYDASDGATYPSFDPASGWIFDSTEWLTTGLAWGALTWTAYIMLRSVTKIYALLGSYSSPSFMLMSQPGISNGYGRAGNGGSFLELTNLAQGANHCLALTGSRFFVNGTVRNTNVPTGAPAADAIIIGATWEVTTATIVAVVICSSAHSDVLIASNSAILAAL